jgi:hypothetical protein
MTAPFPTIATGVPTVAIGDQTPCTEIYLSQQDFLDLFDRILPHEYLVALKAKVGPGYELLQAWAAAKSRLSQAIARMECGAFVTTAHGPALSTVTVAFSRPTAAAGAVTVLKGAIVTTSATGRDFLITEDAVFGPGDVGPIAVGAIAVTPSFQWNVRGPRTSARGEALAGEIDTLKLPLLDPPFGDQTIAVAQVDDAVGGQPGTLDQIGSDRGMERQANESDATYRKRVRSLPDNISPAAILRQLADFMRTLDPTFNAVAAFIETWDIRYQTCWMEQPNGVVGQAQSEPQSGDISTAGGFDPTCFVYDDPRPDFPFRGRWMDEDDHRGAFIVVIPNLPPVYDNGMVYDDPAVTAADLRSPIGRRAVSAYDLPDDLDASMIPCAYDGPDTGKGSIYSNLYALLQSIKAGGISASLELKTTW